MNRRSGAVATVAMVVWMLAACGGADAGGDAAATGGATPEGGLTAAQLEYGIGPIDRLDLGPLDAALAEQGKQVFNLKCFACHRMEDRYVGPPLGEVLERRTPEFVMNMMLNPAEMVEKHPVVKEMLAQYMNPMPFQNMTQDEARAVLEYLRSVHEESGS